MDEQIHRGAKKTDTCGKETVDSPLRKRLRALGKLA